jgi:hypothetical protein
MALFDVTGANLQIAPFELKQLVELELTQKINEHSRLCFKGVIAEEVKDQPIADTAAGTWVELNRVDFDSAKTLLFKGIVSHVAIKAVRDVYYIEVEAHSATKLMDVKLKNRSFQNENLTYESLLKQIVSEYNGAIKDFASKGQKTGKVIIQHNETDFQLLKRLASRFNAGLIPYLLADTPRLYLGIPDEGGEPVKLANAHYRVCKKLGEYRYSSENSIPGITEDDFVYYEVESEQQVNLGAEVSFNGTTLYVCEATSFLENAVLKHHYLIAPKKGLSQKTIYNDQIVGLSLEGRVIDVAKDQVKVHLDIDPEQKVSEAFWFPYSSVYTAEGNSGWYCMPEKEDYVRIYFPSKKEEEGVAVSSVRKDSDDSKHNKLSDPDVKYFRTKAGKELMLSPAELVITGKDDQIFVKLNDKDGITIYSQKAVKVVAKQDLTMESEEAKVIIKAKEGVDISCSSSNITMDQTSIVVKGDEVKTN